MAICAELIKEPSLFVFKRSDTEYTMLKNLIIEAAANTTVYRDGADYLRGITKLVEEKEKEKEREKETEKEKETETEKKTEKEEKTEKPPMEEE